MLLIVLDYISLNNNKLVCFVHSEGWFKIQDLVHQFVNKCRRDACFCMVQTCVESLNNVLKKLCTKLSDSFHPESYNNSDNNNIHMMNIYIFIKNRVFLVGGKGKVLPHQLKVCSFLPSPGKISPSNFHPSKLFCSLPKFSSPH